MRFADGCRTLKGSKFFIVMAMAAIGVNTDIVKPHQDRRETDFMGACCWGGDHGVSLVGNVVVRGMGAGRSDKGETARISLMRD